MCSAPFDGVVTHHLVDVGALVGVAGPTKLATIVQTDPMYVYFNLSEPQVLAIKQSNAKAGLPFRTTDLSSIPVEIGLQGEDGYPHIGHMDYASPQVDQSTGTLLVRAVFDNKDQALLPGLFVRVRTPVSHLPNALLTSNDAIGTSQEGPYVLVVGADNVVQRKMVKTGDRQGQLRIVESGLDPGDWVVTEGLQRAFPGAKVEPATDHARGRRRRLLRASAPPTRRPNDRARERSARGGRRSAPLGRAGAISRFFIERPVLSNVIALVVVLVGLVALFQLPNAQYPNVVPPTVQVTTRYPGASARTLVDFGRPADRAAGQRRRGHDLHAVDQR